MGKLKLSEVPPSALSKVLQNLNQKPRLPLNSNIRSLKLTLAEKNDHFGARHFLQEFLPRIRYANQALPIEVNKVAKKPSDLWAAELEVGLTNGQKRSINLHNKFSTQIARELLDLSAHPTWTVWKSEAVKNKRPLLAGEEKEQEFLKAAGTASRGPIPPVHSRFRRVVRKVQPQTINVGKSRKKMTPAEAEISARQEVQRGERAKYTAERLKEEQVAKAAAQREAKLRKDRLAAEAARPKARSGVGAILP